MTNDTPQEKLKKALKEMFQFDYADLDFGIYRIMNRKRDEIENFIEKDLIKKITEELSQLTDEEKKNAQTKLNELEKEIKQTLGKDAITNGKLKPEFKETPLGSEYLKKRDEIKSIAVSKEQEITIYDHLYNFFSRYYDNGDFISKRRYGGKNRYVVPYNGEETLLYWANNDQYYIKTTENFKTYKFRIPSLDVVFSVVDAEEEKGNVKGTEKFFILDSEKPYEFNKELRVYFQYRALNEEETKEIGSKQKKQNILNERAFDVLKKDLAGNSKLERLFKKEKEEDKNVLLLKRLNTYTAKNKRDYFIHKNLKKFLTRELDFYIKNEVMDLTDPNPEQLARYSVQIKVIKNIAGKIIDFLAQIEDFQKMLWEKKKFVLRTDYLITLDYIDEKYYPTILKNKAQLKEWEKLYGVSPKEINKTFLKENPTMSVDTRFFDDGFKHMFLSTVEKLDKKINGVLINSENYGALNLLSDTYTKKIDCCYIDPPYNTGQSDILYKNYYKHSSWLTLMENRLDLTKKMMEPNGVIEIAIDDYELINLSKLCDSIFESYERNVIIVNHHPQGSGGNNVSRTHEYMLVLVPEGRDILRGKQKEAGIESRSFMLSGPSENKLRRGRPNSFYAILVDPKTKEIKGVEKPPKKDEGYPQEDSPQGWKRLYPIGSNGREQAWCRSYESAIDAIRNGEVKITDNFSVKLLVNTEGHRWTLFSNWVDTRYNSGPHGTKLLRDFFNDASIFLYPKSIYTTLDAIEAATYRKEYSLVCDYFAGSGTTGQAVLKLNKDNKNSHRKFILVEMGQYFDTVLKPRITKVIYSDNWKDGKPLNNDGHPKQIIKYQYLEQYEDTLENIEFAQKTLPETDDYFVSYMLKTETEGSKVFLNIKGMKDPFNYKIKIIEDFQPKETTVDLVETYNYLIGLEVERFRTFDEQNRKYVVLTGKQRDKQLMVVWRDTTDLDLKKDKKFVEGLVTEDIDEVHVNGNSMVKDAKMIEVEFKKRMMSE